MARTTQHNSFFRYTISRPYPLWWFTRVAIIGGIIAFIGASLASFVSSGFEVTSIYLMDPNTVDQRYWFRHWPAWLTGNINGTCEPAGLLVNSQFFTDHTALSYTLSSVTIPQDSGFVDSPSLPYMADVLEKCSVENITMEFTCDLLRNPTEVSSGACTVDVRANTECQINGPNGLTTFMCSAHYNPYQTTVSPGSTSLIATNKNGSQARSSLWWAQQLLNAYWYQTNKQLFEVLNPYNYNDNNTYNVGKNIVEGVAWFSRHQAQQDITQSDFLELGFRFLGADPFAFFYIDKPGTTVEEIIAAPDAAGNSAAPPIWSQADQLAKAMYSTIMRDFGQSAQPSISNIVASPSALQVFTASFPEIHNAGHTIGVPDLWSQIPGNAYPDEPSGPLQVTPSVISTNYLCQVPKIKSPGNLFMSILLADIVLLQTAWSIYCWVVEKFFMHDPTADFCAGCAGASEMQPLNDRSRKHIPSLSLSSITSETRYHPMNIDAQASAERLV